MYQCFLEVLSVNGVAKNDRQLEITRNYASS